MCSINMVILQLFRSRVIVYYVVHPLEVIVHKKKSPIHLICYLFSPGLRMDVTENGKASRRSQHTLTTAAAAMLPW